MLLPTIALLLPTLASALVVPSGLSFQTNPPALSATDDASRVPLTLGVMSKCPDAFLFESLLDKVLKDDRLKQLKGQIDLEMVYIANFDTSKLIEGEMYTATDLEDALSTADVVCKHGPDECRGNVHQLCTQKYLTQSVWWDFIKCENYDSSRIGSDSLARECAKVADFEWTGEIEKCADGKEGKALLRDSVTRAYELGIQKSATLLLGEERRVRCIHDGTWKDCDAGHTVKDLVKSILDEYEHEKA